MVASSVSVGGAGRPVLTIEPGVVVKLATGQGITVGEGAPGEIRASGTAQQPIVFTTAGELAAGRWLGLRLGPESGASRLDHGDVEGAGYAGHPAIRVIGSAPVLNGVTVRTSLHRGISVDAEGAPEITGCTIRGIAEGDGTGIYVALGGRATVSDSVITGSSNGAITVEAGAELNGLAGLVLAGNGQDGIRHLGGTFSRNETWRGFGYPYFLLNGAVDVRGALKPTLTIEPGTVVKVGDLRAISVGQGAAGELRAIGTLEKPILFTTASAAAGGGWLGLQFGPGSAGSRLEHAVVERAGLAATAGIRVAESAPILKDVTVRSTTNRGFSVEAGGSPEITGSRVSGITGGDGTGIHVAAGGRLTISDSVIEGSEGYAFTVELGAELDGLQGMTLAGNGWDGVRHPGGRLATSERWRSFGYPYFLMNDTVRVEGAGRPVLTIEAGTVVKVRDGQAISIGQGAGGELRAVGTAEKPILFTTAGEVAAGKWTGLQFGAGAGTSRLEHAVVEGGGFSRSAGIRVAGSAPVLRDVTVRTNLHRGISIESGGAPEITGGSVSGTKEGDGTGLHLASGSAARVERTGISGNTGAGIVNDGSRSHLRFVALSGNGAEGLLSTSGSLVLRDGTLAGQGVPVRNADPGSLVVDARQQWWSREEGPAGLGGLVEFDPWLGSVPTPDFAITSLDLSTGAFAPGSSHVLFGLALPTPGRWILRILDEGGTEARRFAGAGIEADVRFDGTSEAGAVLPGGLLTFRLEVTEESTGKAAAPLVGRISLDAALPVAYLTSPAGTRLAMVGEELTIEGTAAGPGFESYLLECGTGDFPASWTVVDRGTLPVVAGRLGSFTTALLPPGRYTLRLSVTAAAGRVAVAEARVDLREEGECR